MPQLTWSGAEIEDSELVRNAQAGDRNAFSELVRRYQPASIRLATAVLGNREDAEDEVQNAMCKAFERLDQFQHHSEFSTWLPPNRSKSKPHAASAIEKTIHRVS